MKKIAIIAIILSSLAGACTKEEITPRSYPRVKTVEATDITSGGATFRGEIFFTSVPILDHGFLWSEQSNPTLNGSDKISLGSKSGTGSFEAKCERSMQEGKKYYMRAYALSEDNAVYGNVVEFQSLGSKAPVLKDFFPSTATWDDTVTIVGENFSSVPSNLVVKFNNVAAFIIKGSADSIWVKVPFELTTELSTLSISLTGNTSTIANQFKLKAPVLESINPSTGTAGSNVVITGKFISSMNTKVYFNEVEGTFVQWGPDFIECKAPANLPSGTIEIKVVTGSGNLFDTIPFEVLGPKLLQVSPAVAGEGDEIKLTGDFFSDDPSLNVVMFENTLATVVSASRTELKVIVPPNVNTINPTVSITISGSTASLDQFSFHPPVIESFTPQRGLIGTELVITGKYFRTGSLNKVFIGDMELHAYGSSPTEIHANIPTQSYNHSQKIKVTFEDQEAFSATEFKMPWIFLTGNPDPYNLPTASLAYSDKVYTGFSDGIYNDFWKFDPATKAWTSLTDFPGPRRQSIMTFSTGSKGYFGGGTGSTDDLWEYDFTTDSWTKKSNLPITGIARTAFTYGNAGYMLELDPSLNTKLWKYNQNTDSWALESTAPFTLGIEPGHFVIGNKLYLIVDYNLWEYVFVTNQWKDLGPTPQVMTQCFSIGSVGYGIGYSQLYKYNPTLNIWSLDPSPLPYYPTPTEVISVSGKAFTFIYNIDILEFDPSF